MRKVSPSLVIMQHMPYLDSLWMGEGFWWNMDPDYYLVEASGIPFGLTSESLGAPFELGMIYGMAPRIRNEETKQKAGALWKLWDFFDIHLSNVRGYWDPNCPVSVTHNSNVRATAYVHHRLPIALVVVGRFGSSKVLDNDVRIYANFSHHAIVSVAGLTVHVKPVMEGLPRLNLKRSRRAFLLAANDRIALSKLRKRINQ